MPRSGAAVATNSAERFLTGRGGGRHCPWPANGAAQMVAPPVAPPFAPPFPVARRSPAVRTTLTEKRYFSRVTCWPVPATNGPKLFSKALKVFKGSRRDDADSKTSDPGSLNLSNSSDSSGSNGRRRKWSLPSKVNEFFRKSSPKPVKKNQSEKKQSRESQAKKEDLEEIDSVQENKTQSQPEENMPLRQQENLQQQHKEQFQQPQQQQPQQQQQQQQKKQQKMVQKHDKELPPQQQQYRQQQQEMSQKQHKEQPQQKKQLPQLSMVRQQQPHRHQNQQVEPQPQRRQLQQHRQQQQQLAPQQFQQQQQNQTKQQQRQRQVQPHPRLRQFEQQKLKQLEQRKEIKRQLQPRLEKEAHESFRRSSQWDEIITPQGFSVQFRGDSRPRQRLLPQTEHCSYTLSKRDLELTDSEIIFERISQRQSLQQQLGQIMSKRLSIIETPMGLQRASELHYEDLRIPPKFSYAPSFSLKDLEFSRPKLAQRASPLRKTKSNENSPIKLPHGVQRRFSHAEIQQMKPCYGEPMWRLSSVSQSIAGFSQEPSKTFARSAQCVTGLYQDSSQYAGPSYGPIQNHYRSSPYVAGPAHGIMKNLSQSSQYIAGSSHRPSQTYVHSTHKIVGPSQGQSRRFTSSSQSIVDPSQGPLQTSHSNAHSSQSIVGPSQGSPRHCTGKFQCPKGSSQCHSQNNTNLSQVVTEPSRGPSQYCIGMTQCVLESFQGQSQSISGTSQCSSQKYCGSSQCISGSQCHSQTDNDPSQNIAGSSQSSSQNFINLSQTITAPSKGPLDNYTSTSQSVVGTSQDLSKNMAQTTESPTNGAESSLSVPGLSQSTVGHSKSVADSSKCIKDSSKNGPGPSKSTNGPSKSTGSPSKSTVDFSESTTGPSKSTIDLSESTTGPSKSKENRSENVPISQDPFLNIAGLSNEPHVLSSYSQLVSTLSKKIPNQAQNLINLRPEEVESQEESPSESPRQGSGPLAILTRTIPRAAAVISKMNTALSLTSGMNHDSMVSRPLEYNPILENYDIQQEVATAGPGLIWHIHDAVKRIDEKECSVFIFDKRILNRMYHSKPKELMVDRIRDCVHELENLNHPRFVKILCPPVESRHNIAFATERIFASLHNILAWTESSPIDPNMPYPVIPTPTNIVSSRVTRSLFEIRYGFHQISEALQFMHQTMRQMHRNVFPGNILVTRRGMWKLFGLEFAERIPSDDPMDFLNVPLWSNNISPICQPELDYMAPEAQILGMASTLGDMYSMGMVMSAVFNHGRPLINCNHNPDMYVRQMDQLEVNVARLVSIAPNCLREALPRLLERNPEHRPTPCLLSVMRYFKCSDDPSIQALEALEANILKSISERCEYYVQELPASLPCIPEKLRWLNVWPVLELEFKVPDVISSVLRPVFWFVNNCTHEEFHEIIYPTIRKLIYSQRSIPATVVLLENLHILTKRSSQEVFSDDLLPMLFQSLNSNLYQIQIATLIAVQNVSDIIPDKDLRGAVMAKVKNLVDKNVGDVKIINFVLGIYEKMLPRLDNTSVLTYVVPAMQNMRLGNSDVIDHFVRLYRAIFNEEKFDLTSDVMATEIIPKLAPHVINSNLNVDQFNNIIEILYDMLESVEKIQRERLKAEGVLTPGSNRRNIRRLQIDSNVPAVPFSIPNLRVEKSKTSDVVDVAQGSTEATVSQPASATGSISALKSRIEQWVFGNSTNNDSKFLRLTSILPNRRLSDNTLMTPKIRIVPSSASSPGGTPGAGLPIRRHSNIGPQERRLSSANLLPPTQARQPRGRGSGSSLSVPSTSKVRLQATSTSTSVPFLETISPSSRRGSRVNTENQNNERRQSEYLPHILRLFPNKSASNSPQRRQQNTRNQRSSTSIYATVRRSTDLFIRRCSSLRGSFTGSG